METEISVDGIIASFTWKLKENKSIDIEFQVKK
jgi:hypothetical protein